MSDYRAYNGDSPFIFISYSHKDTDIVMQVVNRMIADGYRVWYDEGIKPGTMWDDFIANKIDRSGLFIAFMSENYLASGNCRDELNYSRDKIENILLIYLSDVSLPSGMELRFGRVQAIPAYNYSDKEAFFEKLYSTHGIECFKNVVVPDVIFPETAAPVVEKSLPKDCFDDVSEAKAPERVNNEPKKAIDKKIFIIAGALVLALILIVAGVFAIAGKQKSKEGSRNSVSDRDRDERDDKESDVVTTASSEETRTERPTNGTYADNVFEQDFNINNFTYLGEGETAYNPEDTIGFFASTGAVCPAYLEEEYYINGIFYATDTMSFRMPVTADGYSEPVNFVLEYQSPDNSTMAIASEVVTPTMVNGEMSYSFVVDGTTFSDGHFPTGTYFMAAIDLDTNEVLAVTRVFHTMDTNGH